MKSDFDNAIDSLLRASRDTVRGGTTAASSAAGPGGGAGIDTPPGRARTADAPAPEGRHLDADELNAYAQNSLPAATRHLYTAHVADCDSCRQIIIGITLALDVAGELERRPTVREEAIAAGVISWRTRVAAVFAPRTLTFAAPALLALVVAGSIFFVALRSREGRVDVAQRTTESEAPAAGVTDDRAQSNEMPPGEIESAARAGNPDAAASSPSPPTPEKTEELAKPPAAAVPSAPAAATTDAARRKAPSPSASSTAQSDASTALIQPAATTAADDTGNLRRAGRRPAKGEEVTVAGETLAEESPARAKREDISINERNTESVPLERRAPTSVAGAGEASGGGGGRRAGAPPPPPSPSASAARPAAPSYKTERPETDRVQRRSRGGDAATDAARDDSAATRRVANRRFRQQGRTWVDTAYTSSMAVINVSRGTEQYRALVADEPELGRIADQLGGEIIVVWKNRAYRIR